MSEELRYHDEENAAERACNAEKGSGARRRSSLSLLALAPAPLALSWASYVALQVEVAGARDDARSTDAIVLLSASQDRGWPSPVFRARLEHAAMLYEEGVAPLVIVAGRNPDSNSYTEAEVGVRYLEDRGGVPPEALLAVGRGDNTYASLREVEALTEREGLRTVLLVSDKFHMFRSLTMAQDLGLQAYGSPTTTSPIEDAPAPRLYYTLREVVAYTAYVLGATASTRTGAWRA
jgi:uncharacterized SAM-binding protein YcdF (DUF218 family)